MTIKKITIVVAVALMIAFVGGCAPSSFPKSPTNMTPDAIPENRNHFEAVQTETSAKNSSANQISSDIKIGFLFVGLPGDYGFTYAQNQGRLGLEEELGVETMAIDNVPEDENCIEAIQQLIDGGCNVIFSCSFGFMEYTAQMADRYPQIKFFHCSGYERRENMSTYFGRMYQMRYLTGIVAGLRTQTNKIGYVAAMPIPEVVRGADAFALGVKSVNPDARVHIKWSYTWLDYELEKALAVELISEGCDVITQHQDTVTPQIAAQEAGVWSIGYNSPMGLFVPDSYLTAGIWNWAPYMIDQITKIDNGTWEAGDYWGGLEDDVVRLDALTQNVAPGTQEAVYKGIADIKGGFDVFVGPIYDNEGNLRVSADEALSDAEKLALDWLVDNIVGRVEW